MRVGDVMHRSVVTVRPEASLREVARLLIEHGISGMPVVDPAGRVVGVVSEADFVMKEGGDRAEPRRRWLDRLFGETEIEHAEQVKVQAATAGEAMTAPPITVAADSPVRDAARIMIERQINRLPVVEGDRLVGIVTRADLVRGFVRSDEELRAAIVEEVLHREMWLDERDVEVAVADGIVTVSGTVEKRSDAAILGRLIRDVPGVIDVAMTVGWRLDDSDLRAPARDLVDPPQGRG